MTGRNFLLFPALTVALYTAAAADGLRFPGNAAMTTEVASPLDSAAVPMGIFDDGIVPVEQVEGQVSQQAWRLPTPSLTTLQLLRPLREQLRNDGFDVLFECQTEACGGFDFRFALDVLPPPQMRVNIGDFRFLTAARESEAGREVLTLLVSRTAQAGFAQVTRITPPDQAPVQNVADAAPSPFLTADARPSDLATQLETHGRAVLSDLDFTVGAAQLADQDFTSLAALAAYLAANPQRQVALVGHTDATGSLDANIALSKRRAAAVLERLAGKYAVPRAQMAAEGMGYLAPLATNLTEEGREANRRVEVIIVSTQE